LKVNVFRVFDVATFSAYYFITHSCFYGLHKQLQPATSATPATASYLSSNHQRLQQPSATSVATTNYLSTTHQLPQTSASTISYLSSNCQLPQY